MGTILALSLLWGVMIPFPEPVIDSSAERFAPVADDDDDDDDDDYETCLDDAIRHTYEAAQEDDNDLPF